MTHLMAVGLDVRKRVVEITKIADCLPVCLKKKTKKTTTKSFG